MYRDLKGYVGFSKEGILGILYFERSRLDVKEIIR